MHMNFCLVGGSSLSTGGGWREGFREGHPFRPWRSGPGARAGGWVERKKSLSNQGALLCYQERQMEEASARAPPQTSSRRS